MAVSRIVSNAFANGEPSVDFRNPGHTLLPTFPSFRPVGMVGEAGLPSNVFHQRTTDYTLYSGVHICWSELSDSSFVYGFGLCYIYEFGLWLGYHDYYYLTLYNDISKQMYFFYVKRQSKKRPFERCRNLSTYIMNGCLV